ncbi:unnamed protein product [Discosporangium mesarthrocarpum]
MSEQDSLSDTNPVKREGFIRLALLGMVSTLELATGPRGSDAMEAAGVSSAPYLVNFSDSRGLFSCQLPTSFLRAERNKDKRGTVFVAGDYNKAEIVSVQLLSASKLLSDAGIPPLGDLTTWKGVGSAERVAELLKARRDQDAAGVTAQESEVIRGTASIKGDTLEFLLKSPIKVQRPDLLMEQRGVSELYRNTYARAIMRGDGTFFIVWAGALNTDWEGEDGAKDLLHGVVDSFQLEGMVVNGVRLGPAT